MISLFQEVSLKICFHTINRSERKQFFKWRLVIDNRGTLAGKTAVVRKYCSSLNFAQIGCQYPHMLLK